MHDGNQPKTWTVLFPHSGQDRTGREIGRAVVQCCTGQDRTGQDRTVPSMIEPCKMQRGSNAASGQGQQGQQGQLGRDGQ
jgi:hypothetical protein